MYRLSFLVSVGASIQGNHPSASANLLRLYQQHFETHFLRATEEYYKSLASGSQLSADIRNYIEKVRCSSAFFLLFIRLSSNLDFNIHKTRRKSCRKIYSQLNSRSST